MASPDLARLTVEQLRLSAAVRAPNTIKAYGNDWAHFTAWCEVHCCASLPASVETVACYLTDRLNRGRRVSSAVRWATSISYYHRAAGLPLPTAGGELARLLTGAQRLRKEQPKQKIPVAVEHLKQICRVPAVGLVPTRDRAILLVGFCSALRRSNLAALDLEDIELTALGFKVRVRSSKNDQEGVGRELGIPVGNHDTCPVRALQAYLLLRRLGPGPLFQRADRGRRATGGRMDPNRISLIVKAQMERLGVDPKTVGAHSTRAGHVTEALANNVDHAVIMRMTGHRSFSSLMKYFRESDPFRSNSASLLGL